MQRPTMNRYGILVATNAIGVMLSASMIGCRDDTPPPQRVPVPSANEPDRRHAMRAEREDEVAMAAPAPAARRGYDREREQIKPLPSQHQEGDEGPPFEDVPLVSQHAPEQAAFVDAYRRVGSPRIILMVNRAAASDDANIRSIDYGAIENIMTDWLANNGNVTILSPSGSGGTHNNAGQLGADIVVHVQAQPTRQTQDGSGFRIVAESVNTRGGQSIGRAVVDVPPPLDKTTINKYTRFLARKLMDDMTQTWMSPPPPDHDAGPPPAAPSTQPQR